MAKSLVCELCGKEVHVVKEGKNPSNPICCGKVMTLKK